LIQVPIIRKAVVALIKEFKGSMYSGLRNSLIEKDSSFTKDLPFLLEDVSYSLLHHKELTSTISQVEPAGDDTVYFVYLNGDRLYTERGKNLYVYSLSDLYSPIATYPLGGECVSGIITDNHLYLGGEKKLHIFEVSASTTQPLKQVKVIDTEYYALKILKLGQELLLGQADGYF
jgi:hypothetical protein